LATAQALTSTLRDMAQAARGSGRRAPDVSDGAGRVVAAADLPVHPVLAAAAGGGGLEPGALGVGKAQPQDPQEVGMTSSGETGQVTGTKDKDYNIIWFTEACLSNALRLETYIQDAEREGDAELADFFRRAQAESRKGAEQGKQLLRKRLGS
jgi:hypothetical protein